MEKTENTERGRVVALAHEIIARRAALGRRETDLTELAIWIGVPSLAYARTLTMGQLLAEVL